jgi:Flp pilus assembly protein TadD
LSLLMDALKKAEKDKQERKKLEEGQAPGSSSSPDHDEKTDTTPSGLEMASDVPDLAHGPPPEEAPIPVLENVAFPADSMELQETETAGTQMPRPDSADFRTAGTDDAADAAPGVAEDSAGKSSEIQRSPRARADNLFRAKQPAHSNRRRIFLWGAVVLISILAAGGQGYRLWLAETRPNLFPAETTVHPSMAASVQRPDPALHPFPEAQIDAVPAAGPDDAGSNRPTTEETSAVSPATLSVFPRVPPVSGGDGQMGSAAVLRTDEKDLSEPVRPPGAASGLKTRMFSPDSSQGEPPAFPTAKAFLPGPSIGRPTGSFPPWSVPGGEQVNIVRIHRVDPIDTQATAAYQAFLEKDFQAASREYGKILGRDPNHRDALAGLAAIAVASGRPEEAGRIYARLLELNPWDALAQAGVMAYSTDTSGSEARIKNLIDKQPEVPFLYFVLGNRYALQSNWPSARQAFFDALRLDPENPDYAFNLAVSLEHLRQARLAAENYQKAMDLSDHRPAAFDRDVARTRLRRLAEGNRP